MYKLALFASLAYFAVDCHMINYIYNGRIYPGSKILVVIREPPDNFNPFYGGPPATTIAPKVTTTTVTTMAPEVVTSTTRTVTTITPEVASTTRPVSSTPDIIEITTELYKTTEVEIPPSSVTEECSSCDGNCVLSQNRCTINSDCPPCYRCYSDEYHIYNICKHVNHLHVTTSVPPSTIFSTIVTDHSPDVEIFDPTLDNTNKKREEDYSSTVAAPSPTLHVNTTHTEIVPTFTTQNPTTTSNRSAITTEKITSSATVHNTIITPEQTQTASKPKFSVTAPVETGVTSAGGEFITEVTGNGTATSESTTINSSSTTKVTNTVTSAVTTTDKVTTFPNTTTSKVESTVANTTPTKESVSTSIVTEPAATTVINITATVPTTSTTELNHSDTTTIAVTTSTPLDDTTNDTKTTSQSAFTMVQSTTPVAATTVAENVTTTFISTSKTTTNDIVSSASLPVTFTPQGTNITAVPTPDDKLTVKILIDSLTKTVASVIIDLVTKIMNSTLISDIDDNITESTVTSTRKSDITTIRVPINTTHTEIVPTFTTQKPTTTSNRTEVTTQKITSNGTVHNTITAEQGLTSSKPKFSVTASVETGVTSDKGEFRTEVTGNSAESKVTTVFSISSLVPTAALTTTKKPETTTILSSNVTTTVELTTPAINTTVAFTIPNINATTTSPSTTIKPTTRRIEENETTVAIPVTTDIVPDVTTSTTIPTTLVIEEPKSKQTTTSVPSTIISTVSNIPATNNTSIITTLGIKVITTAVLNASDITTVLPINRIDKETKINETTTVSVVVSTLPDLIINTTFPNLNGTGQVKTNQTSTTGPSVVSTLLTTIHVDGSTKKIPIHPTTLRNGEENVVTIKETTPAASTTVSASEATVKIVNQTEVPPLIVPTVKTTLSQLTTTISNQITTREPITISGPVTDRDQSTNVTSSTPRAPTPTPILIPKIPDDNVELIEETNLGSGGGSGDDNEIDSGSGEKILEEYDDEDYTNRISPKSTFDSLKGESDNDDLVVE